LFVALEYWDSDFKVCTSKQVLATPIWVICPVPF